MNAAPETLAAEKEALLMRSALCRLRLRRATHQLRVSLDWRQAALTKASAAVGPRIAFGLALSFLGLARTAGIVRLLARIVVFSKLVRVAIDVVRRPANPPVCAIEQTAAPIARILRG